MSLPFANFGDYEILEPLGGSGYGSSYLARQKSLDRKVVVKILANPTPRKMRRFKSEAQMLGEHTDPRIIGVHESGNHKGHRYFVMDFIPGESFRSLARKARLGHVDLRGSVELMIQVCEALDSVHNHGIVHRNLKPENLIRHDSGEPRILDFGLARRGLDQSLSGMTGDEEARIYRSPEQLKSPALAVDFRSDLFALGVILHELLTGWHPFAGSTFAEMETKILQGEPDHRLQKSLPTDLRAILARALQKQPEHRYPTAGRMAEDLRSFLQGRAPRHPLPGRLQRFRSMIHRNSGTAAAIVFLAVAMSLAIAWHQKNRFVPGSPINLIAYNSPGFSDIFEEYAEKTRKSLRGTHLEHLADIRFPADFLHPNQTPKPVHLTNSTSTPSSYPSKRKLATLKMTEKEKRERMLQVLQNPNIPLKVKMEMYPEFKIWRD